MYTCIEEGDGLSISLHHIKSHLRLDSNLEDDYLEKLIKTATKSIENYLQRSLILKTWKCLIPNQNSVTIHNIKLYHPPLFNILNVCEILSETEKRTIKRYTLTPHTHIPTLSVYGKSIEVTYKAGYGENYLNIPEPLQQAITLLVGEMFEKRVECVDVVNESVKFLLQPYRILPCL